MADLTIKAFAKVNLGLKILKKRMDGYHNIETVMQTVSLFDQLHISLKNNDILITTNNPQLPCDKSNLCYKAAIAFMKKIGQKTGVLIHIEKNIPIGGGLGGGSSDAASVLKALNILLATPLSNRDLKKLAFLVGSDVPFFIDGGTAYVSGRGEKLKAIKPEPFLRYIIVYPGFSIDTKWAYSKINFLTNIKNYIRIPDYNFDTTAIRKNTTWLKNDFEEVMLREFGELRVVKQFLSQNGAVTVSLSGSGSSVYGIFDDEEKLNRAFRLISNKVYWAKKAFSIPSSKIPQFSYKNKEELQWR